MRLVISATAGLLFAMLLPVNSVNGEPNKTNKRILPKHQMVVSARKVNWKIEYSMGDMRFKKAELNECIGEARLNSSLESDVVIVLEDTMALSDIKEVPQMALAAGFKLVRVFAYWKGTGNMAELLRPGRETQSEPSAGVTRLEFLVG
jgi:hypothetical protein